MKRNLILILLMCILSIGCSTSYQTQNSSRNQSLQQMVESTKNDIAANAKSFIGQPKSKLLKAWGPPKSKSEDGEGGEIYSYVNSTNLSSQTLTIYVNMYINKEGLVYYSDVKPLLN